MALSGWHLWVAVIMAISMSLVVGGMRVAGHWKQYRRYRDQKRQREAHPEG